MTRARELAARAIRPLEWAGGTIALAAMVLVGLRSALHLELRWDTFYYHLPFAAMRAHLGVPYLPQPDTAALYQGYPPLVELLQGILWRLSGTVHATGIVNYVALLVFLYFCWKHLGASLWLLTLLVLTTPMVLIHAATSYIDLFTEATLAIGTAGVLSMLLFNRWDDRRLLLWTLSGTTLAAWSKYTASAPVLLVFMVLLFRYGTWLRNPITRQKALAQLRPVLLAMIVAALPMAKNEVLYGNPTWPVQPPVFGNHFPSTFDMQRERRTQAPPMFAGASQSELFFRSLFEIHHPTSYPNRERWIIDQGNAWIAYRSGGFWVIAVITGAVSAALLGFLHTRRAGWRMTAVILFLWCFVSILPQSHYLRYFMFLPLTISAAIAILIPRVRLLYPLTTFVLMCLMVGEFIYIAHVNHVYFRVDPTSYAQAAEAWGFKDYWSHLETGKTYCAVGFEPSAFMLTGPTMHEFRIVEQEQPSKCPSGTTLLQH
jgi:hypothetical protein